LLFSAYDYTRSVFHDRAAAVMGSRTYNGLAPRRSGAFAGENPLIWEGIAELSNAYVQAPIDVRASFRPESVVTFYKAERSPAIDAAMQSEPFRRFLEFVQYPIWVSEPATEPEHATRVSLVDLRFGTPAAPGFEAVATVSDRNQVVDSNLNFGLPRQR
jgi:inner membrane protein